jgi:hypothetical protein
VTQQLTGSDDDAVTGLSLTEQEQVEGITQNFKSEKDFNYFKVMK